MVSYGALVVSLVISPQDFTQPIGKDLGGVLDSSPLGLRSIMQKLIEAWIIVVFNGEVDGLTLAGYTVMPKAKKRKTRKGFPLFLCRLSCRE